MSQTEQRDLIANIINALAAAGITSGVAVTVDMRLLHLTCISVDMLAVGNALWTAGYNAQHNFRTRTLTIHSA